MVHMTKSHLLGAVATLCGIFFAVQFYLIQDASHSFHRGRKSYESEYRKQAGNRDDKSGRHIRSIPQNDNEKKKLAYSNAHDFSAACQQNAVPVFVADVDVLSSVVSGSSHNNDTCRFLCHTRSTTTFGVLAKYWREQVVMERVYQLGFLVSTASTHHPWADDGSSINIHHMFQRGGHMIHLVVFWEPPLATVGGGVWWYGACDACARYLPPGDAQHLATHPGIVDPVELVKVTMDDIPLRAPRFPRLFLSQIPHAHFIQCNTSRAALFKKSYGVDTSEDAQVFQQLVQNVLLSAKTALDQLEVRFWLSSGTCLGWFRQCDVIPYSQDVDIGIWIKDYNDKIVPTMKAHGLDVKFIFGKVSDSYEISFHGDGIKLDIFFFYEDSHYMWNGGTQTKTGKKFKYLFPKFTLCWTIFLGLKVRVPCETQAYIEANYGRNWYEPVKKWDWKKSPPNVWENGEWPKDEWSEVIREFER